MGARSYGVTWDSPISRQFVITETVADSENESLLLTNTSIFDLIEFIKLEGDLSSPTIVTVIDPKYEVSSP